MDSRWDDAAAQGLSDLDLLVYASRLIGAETSLVVWGGGNTSVKRTERDHRGREVRVLRVKGSGSDLKSIQKKDFPGVVIDDIRALLERPDMDDQVMVDYFAHALLEPASPRPSIETPLHGFLAPDAIIHTHADAVLIYGYDAQARRFNLVEANGIDKSADGAHVTIDEGETIYIDSSMGHAYLVAEGCEEALTLGVCSAEDEHLASELMALFSEPTAAP